MDILPGNSNQYGPPAFDAELAQLRNLLTDMTHFLTFQLEQSMQALDGGDRALAQKVMSQNTAIDRYKTAIDAGVMAALAAEYSPANELSGVTSTAKIAAELQKIGDEIKEFARLVAALYDPNTSDPNPAVLVDIVKIGDLVKIQLDKLLAAVGNRESDPLYALLQVKLDCENELQLGLKRQLNAVVQDSRMIGRAVHLMQIMKVLEGCGEHCRHIAEHLIFMIDGVDADDQAPMPGAGLYTNPSGLVH